MLRFLTGVFTLITVASTLFAQAAPSPDPAGNEFFEKKIRPVLATNCFPCHSAMTPKVQGGLHLDSRDGLRAGGNSGSPIVPGDPDRSLLIKALRYSDPTLKMPPGKALAPEVVADFENWVRIGAPDPRTEVPKAKASASSRDWWSYKKPVQPAVPQLPGNTPWVKSPIDNFILAKLRESQLTPSPPADKRTLIRRATYDLIGLPPTQKDIDDFVQDRSPNAFSKVVDRLLASPQYGVRWGRHWMDVSRYADTSDGANRFAFAYTYRDWVIRAFNQDMPFDQFAKKQIAADQLPQSDRRDLAALGFLTLGRSVPKGENDMIDDRIDAIARGFLGMTVTCARCHDHKFDPIPTRDYYSFYGIIANSKEPVEYPLIQTEDENAPLVKEYRDGMERRLAALDAFKTKRHAELVAEFRQASWIARYLLGAQRAAKMSNSEIEGLSRDSDFNLFVLRRWREYLNKTRESNNPVFAAWNTLSAIPADRFSIEAPKVLSALPSGANKEISQALATAPLTSLDDVAKIYGDVLAKFDASEVNPDPNGEALRQVLRAEGTPTNVPLADFIQIRGAGGDDNILGGLEGAIRSWEAQFGYRGITPRAMVVEEPAQLIKAHVFVRGNPNNLGVEAPPHFLTALSPTGTPQPFTHGSGRLDLANAIADPSNPLTARVIVNRVWQWHFGRGIVNTPSDFGARGDLPSHPELLDYLATQFMEEGWSIKKLHRAIMLSSVYQQSSADRPDARAIDSENKLLWRTNRQRLDYESLRDSILFVSGQLDPAIGGLPFSLSAVPTVPRRSAFAYIERGHLPGELSAFDFAIPEAHVPQRFLTTVPQQALFLMNSPFIMEESQHLIDRREIESAAANQPRVNALYHLVYGRAATPSEVQLALAYIQGETAKQFATAAPLWQYGLSSLNRSGQIARFEPLRYFADQKWQPASLSPQPVFGFAEISPKGGTPPDDPARGITRRWISPVSGTIEVSGTLIHKVTQDAEAYRKHWSNGVHARIIVNRTNVVAEEIVNNGQSDVLVRELPVKAGDTVDFVVNSVKDPENVDFQWSPVITLSGGKQTWDAARDFKGPDPLTLNPWEKLAQVLFETSEFAFID